MARDGTFSKLLEPGRIGQVKTKNRIVRSAAGIIYLDDDFFVIREQTIPLYEALARGGAGLIILGGVIVEYPLGTCHPGQMLFSDDKYMPGYQEIAEVVHKYNCPIFVQYPRNSAKSILYQINHTFFNTFIHKNSGKKSENGLTLHPNP